MQMKQVIQLHRKDSDCNAYFCNDTVRFTPSVKSKNNQEVSEYICTIILWCAIGEIKKNAVCTARTFLMIVHQNDLSNVINNENLIIHNK